ncbi:MAG: gamma-glutamyl-gamma-aminobutyrate hydrolase family protein [Erysipelotrichaceae bacterium]|jgi:putative glutamine amidotransferase|nr:gamma-glutamyl-gamma-aminobutyrate hydrolase family protein [Erysipelotrichaceae bacterium]
MKPIIAVTPREVINNNTEIRYDNKNYFTYIEHAGGIPMMCSMNPEDSDTAAIHFDGLLITGGKDIDPSLYHETNKYSFEPSLDLDQNDLALYYAFRSLNKPIFGICRGIQVIGVAEGVSLIQDLPASNAENHHKTMHLNTFHNDSILFPFFTKESEVNSFHHQALASVPNGFLPSSRSKTDHIIEAIEKDNILGVQWHPERMDDPASLELAEHFIHSCLLHQTK